MILVTGMFKIVRLLKPRKIRVVTGIVRDELVIYQSTASTDEDILDLWARIKSKMWHFEIQNYQVANWFNKNYHLEVGLLDFDPPRPPALFTVEMLTAFYHVLDQYAGRR